MDLEETIERLNEKLRPIADRPVEFGRDMLKRLAALPKPLDEAGIRDEAQAALVATVDRYVNGSDEERASIRALFRKNRAFAWATTLPFPPDSEERLRKHLAHFSILDQFPDYRDALLWLADLRKSPFFESVRAGIAAISTEATRKVINGR